MVTGRSHVLHNGLEIVAAGEQADVPPDFAFFEAVEAVACRDTGLAATASIEIDLERILLALFGSRQRNEIFIKRFVGGTQSQTDSAGKTFQRPSVLAATR